MLLRALSFTLLALPLAVVAQDVIQQLVNDVSSDAMVADLEALTGEVPVDLGTGEVHIVSRFRSNAGNAVAGQWIAARLAEMGYTVSTQEFGALGVNVLAERVGLVHPERKVVLSAHYDAMPGGGMAAPAADDDGTGVCTVLEAARLMADMDFENSVVFAFFDEEEQGLIGSARYTTIAAANDLDVVGNINVDMVGYDGNGDRAMRVHTRTVANSVALKDTVLAVNQRYGIDMSMIVVQPGLTYSDHASFWSEGFGAVLLIEDFEGDGNPHYHLPTDLIEHLDLDYWTDVSRIAVAATAALAIPYAGGTAVVQVATPPVLFYQAGGADLVLELSVPERVQLDVFDASGRSVQRIHEGMLPTGATRFTGALARLGAGAYLVRLVSGSRARVLRVVVAP